MPACPTSLPLPFSPLGTLGAVIVMEPRMGHRKALFDIGITGPLAGLVPTFIFLIVGLHYSTYDDRVPNTAWLFGDPLLFQFLATQILGPIPPGKDVIHASDGVCRLGRAADHVAEPDAHRATRRRPRALRPAAAEGEQNRLAPAARGRCPGGVGLQELGVWMLMLILLIVMGPVHPPTADDNEPLGIVRTVLGWLTLAFIIIGFTPTPISLS